MKLVFPLQRLRRDQVTLLSCFTCNVTDLYCLLHFSLTLHATGSTSMLSRENSRVRWCTCASFYFLEQVQYLFSLLVTHRQPAPFRRISLINTSVFKKSFEVVQTRVNSLGSFVQSSIGDSECSGSACGGGLLCCWTSAHCS